MSKTDTPIKIVAAPSPCGQAWRLEPEGRAGGAGEDYRHSAFSDSHRNSAGEGHIGTRLTLQADADRRRNAETDAGWDRFVLLANLRNLELAGKVVVK
jgi:hypothetical protein